MPKFPPTGQTGEGLGPPNPGLTALYGGMIMPEFKGRADTSGARVLEARGKVLKGECRKCGQCCRDAKPQCPYLKNEVWDGISVSICTIYQDRPWYCAFFPYDPDFEMPEGCGFRWEKLSDG